MSQALQDLPRCVHDIMTHHPVMLSPENDLTVAQDLIRLGRLRHLPVVDDHGKIQGVLSDKDLACGPLFRAFGLQRATERRMLARIQVREVMANRVRTTTPGTSLAAAATQLSHWKISCLPVLENDSVVGMLTETDFVIALSDPKGMHASRGEVRDETNDAHRSVKDDGWLGLESEFDHLRTIRDELRVQQRLATMEARSGYEETERRWSALERDLSKDLSQDGESHEKAIREGRNFVKEARALYEQLRHTLDEL